MAQEKRNQRIPGYLTATEQELITMAAALERRDPPSWVKLVLLDAARERIALAAATTPPVPGPVAAVPARLMPPPVTVMAPPMPMPRLIPPSPPTIEVGDDSR